MEDVEEKKNGVVSVEVVIMEMDESFIFRWDIILFIEFDVIFNKVLVLVLFCVFYYKKSECVDFECKLFFYIVEI